MKMILSFAAAGFVSASVLIPVAPVAAQTVVHKRTVVSTNYHRPARWHSRRVCK